MPLLDQRVDDAVVYALEGGGVGGFGVLLGWVGAGHAFGAAAGGEVGEGCGVGSVFFVGVVDEDSCFEEGGLYAVGEGEVSAHFCT